MIEAVLFDLDGVLVRTDGLHYLAWKQIADAESIFFDERINDRLRGVSRMESLEIILERARRTYGSAEKQALAERKNAIYRDLLMGMGPGDVLPGVGPVLDGLRAAGIKIAVGSSSKNAGTILDRCDLARLFDAVVDGNDISHSKPHPEVFLLAASRLGVPPARCLVVEDAMAGIEAARNAGMRYVGVGTPETMPGVSPLIGGLADVDADRLIAAHLQ